jgi:hypothetical protein
LKSAIFLFVFFFSSTHAGTDQIKNACCRCDFSMGKRCLMLINHCILKNKNLCHSGLLGSGCTYLYHSNPEPSSGIWLDHVTCYSQP